MTPIREISWRFLHSRAYLVAINLFICNLRLVRSLYIAVRGRFESASNNGNKLICFGISLTRRLGALRTFRSACVRALVFVYIVCLLALRLRSMLIRRQTLATSLYWSLKQYGCMSMRVSILHLRQTRNHEVCF